ncbi:agmatine/peptidylarginine deiminase [Nocardia sp. NPDC051570]|uniref:agmatine/peptidylarginine deiminase n=1 Tax=Nocardia sp. NPDC051570 TaxID=3364324 RepID=UPI0037B94735
MLTCRPVPPGEPTLAPPGGSEVRMLEEIHPHARTFMAWPARRRIWHADLAEVRRDVAGLVEVISRYEPVVVLACPAHLDEVRHVCGPGIEVLAIPVDDLWIRDTGPTFVATEDGLAGVDTNFNGWGRKQIHTRDAQVARQVLAHYGLPRIEAALVTEGGNLECDGRGTLMTTESAIVNGNRNPDRTREQLEADLRAVLGVRKVIWLPGIRGADITDGHVDTMVRFARPGVVLLDKPGPGASADRIRLYHEDCEILEASTDADGHRFEVIDLVEPDWAEIGNRGKEFFASYVNYYVVNGAVLVPVFGDRAADRRAAGLLADCYPGREVVPVYIDTLAEGGGGIHCATQQQPRLL